LSWRPGLLAVAPLIEAARTHNQTGAAETAPTGRG